MPSNAYFYNSKSIPLWESTHINNTERKAERRRDIADAILRHIPNAEEVFSANSESYIALDLPIISCLIHHNFVHLKIPYWDSFVLRQFKLTEQLLQLSEVLEEYFGFDFFDHSDYILGERADIEGTLGRIASISEQTWATGNEGVDIYAAL